MALVIETGSGVADANSYISVVDAQTFIDARSVSTTITEGLLLRAMDELETLDFKGYRVEDSQSLSFPRSSVYLSDDRLLANDTIPEELKRAQVWLAHYIDAGYDPSAATEQAVKREKVDVLEVEYQDYSTGKQSVMTLPNVANLLKNLINTNWNISRA